VVLSGELFMKIRSALKLLLLNGIFLTVFLPVPGVTSDWGFQSETILRIFEREVRENGKDRKQDILPMYEYLRVDVRNLSKEELSFHSYGWARHDLENSGFFADDTEGELLYGYLEYASSFNNFSVRLGRQYVFERALNESMDGLLVNADISPSTSIMAYGGRPISLGDTDGSSGDATVGGRIANHSGNRYEIGLFFTYVANDGDRDEEEAGFDLSLLLPRQISLAGRSRRNLVTDGWAEHAYEGMSKIGKAQVSLSFDYFQYEDFLIKGDNSANLFRFLSDTKETITAFGSDMIYNITETVDFGAKLKHYDYDRRPHSAQYYSGLMVWRWEAPSELGVELGFMNGDASDNRYYLGRVFAYKDLPPGFITADVVYAHYNEDVQGEDRSVFVSLGAGKNFLDDTVKVKLSGDFSSDPFFESDFRGMVNITYNFDSAGSSE